MDSVVTILLQMFCGGIASILWGVNMERVGFIRFMFGWMAMFGVYPILLKYII